MFITNNNSLSNSKAMTLVEIMLVLCITSILMAGLFYTLSSGKDSWLTTETQMQLQQSARQILDRVSKELRESGLDKNGIHQVTIINGGGIGGSDQLKFSIPVMCEANKSVIDANGDVSYWRAPLTWGCTQSSCMDADNDCASVDYKSIQYEVEANQKFVRKILDNGGLTVAGSSKEFAQNVTDFQVSLSADQRVVTLILTVTKNTDFKRAVTATISMDVYLRNRG